MSSERQAPVSRWTVLFAALAIALTLALVVVTRDRVSDRERSAPTVEELLADETARAEAVDRLVARSAGVWDTHNDPDVGRILQPNLRDREFDGARISSNTWGVRERQYPLPRPNRIFRVVLLGDSFVFGHGAAAEDRVGVFLQRFLDERKTTRERVEVLHVGMTSWNVKAACSYVRRHLSRLAPDLVIHLTVANDLDDVYGARGFGSIGRFTTSDREWADAAMGASHAAVFMGRKEKNHLETGLDHESRRRYAEAASEIERLVAALDRAGARYLGVLHWRGLNAIALEHLFPSFDPDQLVLLSTEFAYERDYWVSEDDHHWNRRGAERVAKLLFGVIQERELLPSLAPAEWDEARAEVEAIHGQAVKEASRPAPIEDWLEERPIESALEFAETDVGLGYQIYGGVDGEHLAMPHAVMVLRNRGARSLVVEVEGLALPEIDGLSVSVRVDDVAVGSFEVPHDRTTEFAVELPAALREREFLTVTLDADDYAYWGPALQACRAYRLLRVALE